MIQRYGLEVAGGSELHCRWLASRLARHHQVEVATTCALDYSEWKNHFPPGASQVDGIPVTRYPVARPRSQARFSQIQDLVFREEHSLDDDGRKKVLSKTRCRLREEPGQAPRLAPNPPVTSLCSAS